MSAEEKRKIAAKAMAEYFVAELYESDEANPQLKETETKDRASLMIQSSLMLLREYARGESSELIDWLTSEH